MCRLLLYAYILLILRFGEGYMKAGPKGDTEERAGGEFMGVGSSPL